MTNEKEFKNIKAIIFDFDETMYYSPNIKEYYTSYIKTTLKKLSKLTDDEIVSKMQEYGFMSNGEKRISFGKNCEKFGVTKEAWNNYRIDNFFQIDYKNAITANNNTYKKLADKYKLFIVSNELLDNVLFKAKMMNIDLSPFSLIVAPTKDNIIGYKSDKIITYQALLDKYNLKASEVFVVGDRYEVDIKPLIQLGGQGLLVKKATEIDEYFN